MRRKSFDELKQLYITKRSSRLKSDRLLATEIHALVRAYETGNKRALIERGEACYHFYADMNGSYAANLRETMWLNYLQDLVTRPTCVRDAKFSDAKKAWQEIDALSNLSSDFNCRLERLTSHVIGALYFDDDQQVAINQAHQLLTAFSNA